MERKYSIDLLRIISAIAVIAIHVCSSPVTYSVQPLSEALKNTFFTIQLLLSWCIPVFFMITGFCILRKKEYTYKQCFPHVLRFVIVLLTVGLLYSLMEEVFLAKTVNFTVIFKAIINTLAGKSWVHMWYVYTIIGIYLVLPLLHTFMKTGKTNRIVLTSILFVLTIVIPFFKPWFAFGITIPLNGYCFYVCFGGMVAYGDFGKNAKYFALSLAIIALAGAFLNIEDYFGYQKLPTCLIACAFFMFISNLNIKPSKLLLTISQCTWGIYLLHPLFVNVAVKVLKIDFFKFIPFFSISIFGIAVSLLSFGVTYLLRKIPVVRKIF